VASKSKQRAAHTEPAATAVRYFQLYEALTAGGQAKAYPCRWDTQTGTWKKISVPYDQLRYIYDRKSGNGGKIDDFVQCVWMAGSRRWEDVGDRPALFIAGSRRAR
jgi:hypothetical protein